MAKAEKVIEPQVLRDAIVDAVCYYCCPSEVGINVPRKGCKRQINKCRACWYNTMKDFDIVFRRK